MFDKVSLRTKLLTGTLVPLLIVVAVGVISSKSITSLLESNQWVNHTNIVIREAMQITASAVDMETGMRGYLVAGKEEFLDPYKSGYKNFERQIASLQDTVSDNPAQVQLLGEIKELIESWVENVTEPQIAMRRGARDGGHTMQDVVSLVGEARGKAYFDSFREKIGTFIEREETLMEARKEAAGKLADKAQLTIIVGITTAVLVSALVAILLASSITSQFKRLFRGLETFSTSELNLLGEDFDEVINGLSSGADQVANVSLQVNESSQQLASGASQQASSIEEISSTLEEMYSITKTNADNANEARQLSAGAEAEAINGRDAINKMAQMIDQMSAAVGRIKDSADKTSHIIKTIDEVAFQTNILALNAAVEAARAGEAGRGFAVVAEEVRNLAQRCAEAARDTSELIEESSRNAEGGVSASSDVQSGLKKIIEENISAIVEGIGKVRAINESVSSASVEQSRGISQVSEAVAQMSDLTQNNAASAEESSAASEELSSQSEELKQQTKTLLKVTKGSSFDSATSRGFSLEMDS